MKIICNQQNLSKGLEIVSKLSSQNINLPILGNVLFECKDDELSLSCTNLETSINCFVKGKVKETGKIAILASLITNYIGSLNNGKVTLESKCDNLEIKTADDNANIKGLPTSEFPFKHSMIEKMKKGTRFEVCESDIKEGLKNVEFASANDDLRSEIAGVFFSFTKDQLTLVATDSYRLAEKKLKIKTSNTFEAIIPIKAIRELLRVLQDNDEDIGIFFNDGQVLFEIGEIDFMARLVEGQYPDYKQIIPKDLSTKVEVDSVEFSQAIKRAGLFTAKETNDIKFNIGEKEILITAEANQSGKNESKVDASISGKSQEVVYNYRYFLDGLSNIPTKSVLFEVNSADEPGVLRGDSFIYLMMPIRD